MKYISLIFIIFVLLFGFKYSLNAQNVKKMNFEKKEDKITQKGTYIITAPIIYKNFFGKKPNSKQLCVKRSIQDYYIKFCHSKITREDLEQYLSKQKGKIKTATLEVEFFYGDFADCDSNVVEQSPSGEYIIIHKIIK